MNVIAIVVTYKRKDLLSKVLSALENQTFKLSKILVIDNNSQDGTESLVKGLAKSNTEITYFNTGDNLGGAGGFHFGFKAADEYDYDYLWLMDDDLLPENDCLEMLLKSNPKGIVQPLRFNLDGSCAEISPVEYNLDKVFCKNPKVNTVLDIYPGFVGDEVIDIAAVPFEGPLISHEVVKKIGFPNPNFFIFNDDLDYSLRATNANFSIKCNFGARAKRLLINDQNNDIKSWKGYFMFRNHFYILRNYGGNIFVRNRSIAISFFFVLKFLSKLDMVGMTMIMRSFKDSYFLSNNDANKPG
ncbi:glycosyltransferase [Vibrio parahaemolyticus]|nr:glycosyltransferase [Vibrio parahaemolyticus]